MHGRKVGYVVEVTNSADKGKSLILVPTMVYLVTQCGYEVSDCHGNFDIYLDGYNRHDNDSIRAYVRKMCREHLTGKVIMVDEANGVWPHRAYTDKEQQEDLKGVWQVTKLGNWLLYTNHLGRGVDKNLRDATQIVVIPKYLEASDSVACDVINGEDLNFPYREFIGVSEYFDLYDRWQPVFSQGGIEYVINGFGVNAHPRWYEVLNGKL